MKSLSLTQSSTKPAENIEVAGPENKPTVRVETTNSAANIDQTSATFESGGLSKAQIEAKLIAAVQAGVPEEGTPAYFEYLASRLELLCCSSRS